MAYRDLRPRQRGSTLAADDRCFAAELFMIALSGVLVVAVIVLRWQAAAAIQAMTGGSDQYLYQVQGFDRGPVIELLAPLNTTEEARPDWLYSTNSGSRVVVFYAPWCGHCQQYRSSYVNLARQVKNLTNEVEIYAVSCTVHRPICKRQEIRAYPIVKAFKQGSMNGTMVDPWAHPFSLLKTLGVKTDVEPPPDYRMSSWIQSSSSSSSVKSNIRSSSRRGIKSKTNVYDDAWLSFDFAMRNSVFMEDGPLSNETKHYLANWLELLNDSLPQSWEIHKPIHEIQSSWEQVTQDETRLNEILDRHPPPQKEWSNDCKLTSKHAGYTCGLWQLFHMMTVGVVEWNSHATNANDVFPTLVVANCLRDYIANFFGCEECRVHFLDAYDGCEHDRCIRLNNATTATDGKWQQLPLWLWEMHNSVNVRLNKERAERENREPGPESSVEWPKRSDCPSCWNDNGTWEEEQIYKFLRIQYWPDDATSAKDRRTVLVSRSPIPMPPAWIFFVTLVGLPLVFGVYFFVKKFKRIRSGRHKKDKNSC